MHSAVETSTTPKSATATSRTPWFMLFARVSLFAGVQALFALGFSWAGSSRAWESSASWWPLIVTIANVVCVAGLIRIFRGEGKRYRDIFRFRREHVKGDLLALLGIIIIAAPVAVLPNVLLGGWLFGDASATLELLVRPLPFWAVYALTLLFPVTQGLAEIATYFGYVMPRFASSGMRPSLVIGLCALMLGLQHIAAPLLFDLRFIVWRGLMFIPFALVTGVAMYRRPRMLPYFAIVHVLMNVSVATMFFDVAY